MKVKALLIAFFAAFHNNINAASIQEFMNGFPILKTMPSNATQMEQLPKHELATADVAQYLQQTLNETGQWGGLTVSFYGIGKVNFDGYYIALYEGVTPYQKRYYLCTVDVSNLSAYPQTLQIYCSVGGLVVTDFEVKGKDVVVRKKDFTQELTGYDESVYKINKSITQQNAADKETSNLPVILDRNGEEIVVEEDAQPICAANRKEFIESFPLLNHIPSDLEEADALERVKLCTPDVLKYLQQTFNKIEIWEGVNSMVSYNGIGRVVFDDYAVIVYEVLCPFQRKIYMFVTNDQESQMYPRSLLVYDELRYIEFHVNGMSLSISHLIRSSEFPHVIKEVYSINKHLSLVERKTDFVRGE